MSSLNTLSDALQNEGLAAAISRADEYGVENLNFSEENSNNAMNNIIHDAITVCNDDNFLDVFLLLNKISEKFGLNVSLSLEILSFNLRRNIDLSYQVSFFENLPNSIKDFSDIQMLGAESYRRLGNIDKALNIFSTLPPKQGWWPYDDIWNSLTYNLGSYLLQNNIMFLEHQKSTQWSFPFSSSTQYMISDLVSGLLAPWRHDPMTFKMDIEHILENCCIPKIDMKSQILGFLANRITDLDTNRACVVFELISSYENVELIEKILKNKNFILENLAKNPSFIFYFDLLRQKFIQFSELFFDAIKIFLQSDAVQRFMRGDWVAFEEGYLPKSRILTFEILSRYSNKFENISVDYIPFIEKKSDIPKNDTYNSKEHLFFGLYGIAENLALSLEKAFDYIKNDTKTWRENGNIVSIGISTFNPIEKGLNSYNPTHENLIDYIPERLNKIIEKIKYSNLSDLQEILPNTIQILTEKNKIILDSQRKNINNIFNECDFADNIYVNTLSTETFSRDIGTAFSQYLGNENNPEIENLKTFYCLSGVQELSDMAENSHNVDIDKMVLLNLNTMVLKGSLTNLCEQVGDNRVLSAKMDGKNISIREGITYFVGCKNSVSKIFYTSQFVKNIISSQVLGYLYRDKFSSREIIQTVFYENGCDLDFSLEVELQKMCMNISWLELREALIKDSFNLEDENLLRFIRNETKNDFVG